MIKKNYSELFEFTSAQLARLKKEYEPLKGKTISMDNIRKMDAMLSKYSTDMLMKLANADIPMLSTAAKSMAVMKRGKKWSDFKTKLDMAEADELQQEACWVGYKQVGMKKKGDRMVPNCVKEDLQEADLSKSQVKMVHKKADDLPKKDFRKRYGKDGDAVRYATATNIVKKKLGIEEKYIGDIRGMYTNAQLTRMKADWANKPLSALTKSIQDYVKKLDNPTKAALIAAKINHVSDYVDKTFDENTQPKGDETMNESYKDKFNATMKDFGIKSLGDLKSDEEKKKFFKAVDAKHDAKNEELTPAQKKLPAGLQKAIAKKQDDKKEDKKVEEGFASDAQRKAAFASGYKEKGKDKKEMMKMKASYKKEDDKKEDDKKSDNVEEMMSAKEMMKMNAMKMPIRAMYMKAKKEMKTGDDDMKPMTSMKMNAVTDPKKMNAMAMQDPKQDMAAGYMKSDVRAAVKDGGGADMAKVKDKPVMQEPMKKINAMYMKKESKRYLETKPGSLEEAVLVSRGLVEKK